MGSSRTADSPDQVVTSHRIRSRYRGQSLSPTPNPNKFSFHSTSSSFINTRRAESQESRSKNSKDSGTPCLQIQSRYQVGYAPRTECRRAACSQSSSKSTSRAASPVPVRSIYNPLQSFKTSGEMLPKNTEVAASQRAYLNKNMYSRQIAKRNSCEIQTDKVEIPKDLCENDKNRSSSNSLSHKTSHCWATCDQDEILCECGNGYKVKQKNASTFFNRPSFNEVIIIGRHPPKPPNYYAQTPKFDWNDYHRLSAIHTFLHDLEICYPSLCTVGVIGKSLEGRDLKVLKISNSNVTNTSVWIDAGIHGREWIAPAVATYIAHYIVKDFHTHPKTITNKDWYILPVMNPDGYEYSHTNDRMWRKNRARHKGKCVGVDLNRNFSFGWGGKESSEVPSNAKYRGEQPFSEPESCAVRDMLMNSGISFKVYLTLHSYGQVIMFPYACEDEMCPDYMQLMEGATVMSRAIYDTSGFIYKIGVSRDVMYGAAGTSNDWSYAVCKIPFCYLIELRSRKHKFKLPKDEIQVTGQEIFSCIKALAAYVDQIGCKTRR